MGATRTGAVASSHFWTPKDLAPYAWFDASVASSITDAGSGHVSAWADLSGNNRNVLQGTDGNRPITGTRTINSKNALDYNGVSMALTLTSLTITRPFTVLAVCLIDSVTAHSNGIFDCDSTVNYGYVVSDDANTDKWAMGSTVGGNVDTTHAPSIATRLNIVAIFNGASSTFWENGTQYGGTLNTGTAINGNRLSVGRGGGTTLDGLLAELVVASVSLDAVSMALWNSYVTGKWGA